MYPDKVQNLSTIESKFLGAKGGYIRGSGHHTRADVVAYSDYI